MVRITVSVVLILAAVAASAFSGLMEKRVALSRKDRDAVEHLACLDPFEVKAAHLSGKRYPGMKRGRLYADVRCARHVQTDEYSAYYEGGCSKEKGRWQCDKPRLHLEAGLQGRGPFDITLVGLEVDAGVASLKCLARGLEAEKLMKIDEAGTPYSIEVSTDAATRWRGVEVFMMQTPVTCTRIRLPDSCDASADVALALSPQQCELLYE